MLPYLIYVKSEASILLAAFTEAGNGELANIASILCLTSRFNSIVQVFPLRLILPLVQNIALAKSTIICFTPHILNHSSNICFTIPSSCTPLAFSLIAVLLIYLIKLSFFLINSFSKLL